jgi:hypothetical protein
MFTPYDTDEELLADKSLEIRALNDEFRTELVSPVSALWHKRLVCTSGVAAYGDDFIERALRAVREFSTFNEYNDPYGEHDFGSFVLDDVSLIWKIDLYEEPDVKSENGEPVVTRVLTIMLADEY